MYSANVYSTNAYSAISWASDALLFSAFAVAPLDTSAGPGQAERLEIKRFGSIGPGE